MSKIFFDDWEGLSRTVIATVFAYIALIILLRISGKRTLSKMNSFDFIVTIALGSTLATVLLNKDVALAEGVLALALLIFLQYVITYFSSRHKQISNLVKSTPALLVYKGQMLKGAMRKERVDEDEIYAAIRENGMGRLEEADAVVIETDGSLTVMRSVEAADSGAIQNIQKPSEIKAVMNENGTSEKRQR